MGPFVIEKARLSPIQFAPPSHLISLMVAGFTAVDIDRDVINSRADFICGKIEAIWFDDVLSPSVLAETANETRRFSSSLFSAELVSVAVLSG